MPKQNIIAGLDIGSSKISVVVGNTLHGNAQKIGIIGVGPVSYTHLTLPTILLV